MLPKIYDPKPVEEKFAKLWQEARLFASSVPADKNKKAYVIVIPPPNITGALHMGHALNNTLQDALIRAHRMFGREAYWVPGTDHGGIATQNVIEKKLLKEKKLRRDELGREKFLETMWAWHKECGNTILNQLQRLGCALDLDPEHVRFTMDAQRAQSVYEAFRLMWEKHLIYRGERMINWCVRCGTALSDIEVEHEESHSKLWHIHYPLANGERGVIVATTRPETMLGDTAVAVNPADARYTNLVGKKLKLPVAGRIIPIIADEAVDAAFGTGAVKVTPAHDPVDNEIGRRHRLETITVIDYRGKMANVPEKYLGKDRTLCRHELVEDLKAQGYLEKEEPYKHAVSSCYRCNQPIEPMTSEQWFVKMQELAKPAARAAQDGSVKFHPENWKKPFLEWLGNIQDWCISRQIWWGHRIPVWYCEKCSAAGLVFAETAGKKELVRVSFKNGAKPIVSFAKPAACPDCGGTDLLQDPDVLDTWFSSGLWPFSVFNWPKKSEELDFYYPTSVLVTGYEIIYLWVARMVMMGLEFMGKAPFGDVYIHGIVRDKHGKKMSKSLGNVIDPLDLMQKYGTDAVRFSLAYQALPGKDIPFGEESITGARNFCNKLYNAARFVQMNLPEESAPLAVAQKPAELCDRWILDRYARAIASARESVERYDLAAAAATLYHFLWDEYCDWYVELAKPRLQSKSKETALAVLVETLYGTLKALHPLMPYITEELAATFRPYAGEKGRFLLEERYPAPPASYLDEAAAAEMQEVMGIITAIRTVRSQFNVPPALKIHAHIKTDSPAADAVINRNADCIKLLAKLETLQAGGQTAKPAHSVTAVYKKTAIYLPLQGVIDFAQERQRLAKELAKLEAEAQQCGAKLDDPAFKAHAPAAEVEKILARRQEALSKTAEIKSSMADLA